MLSHSISTHTLSMDWRWCMFHHYQQHAFNCETCLLTLLAVLSLEELRWQELNIWYECPYRNEICVSRTRIITLILREKVVLDILHIRKSLRDTRVVAHYFRTINCWPLWMCIMHIYYLKAEAKTRLTQVSQLLAFYSIITYGFITMETIYRTSSVSSVIIHVLF